MEQTEEFEVVAINDLTDAKTLAHLFNYDTAQGRFNGEIEVKDGAFVVNGQEIKVTAERNPENLPWAELGVDIVLECTGFFTSQEKAEAHIKAGAKKVVISAPATGDVKTLVYNGIKKKVIILEPILPSVKINVFFNKYLFLDSLPILNIIL